MVKLVVDCFDSITQMQGDAACQTRKEAAPGSWALRACADDAPVLVGGRHESQALCRHVDLQRTQPFSVSERMNAAAQVILLTNPSCCSLI